MPNLKNKVAVVTGSTSGIGLACAERFSAEGAAVVGFDIRCSEEWSLLEDKYPDNTFYELDVRDLDSQIKAINETVAKFSQVDILVTAAGVGEAGPVHLLESDTWDKAIDINLKGTFHSIKAVIEPMMAQRSGSIITIASIEGLVGTEGGSAYNASKGGVVLLSKNVAIDYGRMGIRCNAICPGTIDTPMTQSLIEMIPDTMKDWQREIKLGRIGTAKEIAGTAYFLASEDSSYITGQSIVVDGGYTTGHSHGLVELMGLA